MVITPANLDALFTQFSLQYQEAYMGIASSLVDAVASVVPSGTRDNRYPIVQTISGAMREFLGERRVQNVFLDGFTVTNKTWENTLAVKRTDIEDDQYGAYVNQLIPNLARHARVLPDLQVASIISANPVGFDGVDFFSASHPKDPSGQNPGTQSNLVTSAPLNATNLARAQAQFANLVGPDLIPFGCMGDTLLVPPSLEYVADTLANATFFPESKNNAAGVFGAQDNVFKGRYKVAVSPYITDSGDPTTATWYLVDGRDANLRPFGWQMREAPQLVSLVDPANLGVFFQDIYWMGARMRGAAFASLWFKAMKCTA